MMTNKNVEYPNTGHRIQQTEREKRHADFVYCFLCFIIACIIAAIICQCTGHGCSVATAAGKRETMDDARGTIYTVTAYCICEKCCGKWASVYPRRTASGHIIKKGDKFVAATKEIPFGTMLSIPGYNNGKPVPVLDRGGAIKGNKLDVYFDSHAEALRFGRKYLEVRICN